MFVLLAFLIVLNVIVSRGVLLDDGLTWIQRILQILIVWILPIIGSAIVLLMQGQSHSRSEMRSLVPFPLYFVGYDKPLGGPDQKYGEGGAENSEGSCGEGSCGSD